MQDDYIFEKGDSCRHAISYGKSPGEVAFLISISYSIRIDVTKIGFFVRKLERMKR